MTARVQLQAIAASIASGLVVRDDLFIQTKFTNPDHMREDLDIFDFDLKPEEIQQIEKLAAR